MNIHKEALRLSSLEALPQSARPIMSISVSFTWKNRFNDPHNEGVKRLKNPWKIIPFLELMLLICGYGFKYIKKKKTKLKMIPFTDNLERFGNTWRLLLRISSMSADYDTRNIFVLETQMSV